MEVGSTYSSIDAYLEALEKRRSPVLFYLMAAAACWFVYVRDREGVRWTH